MKRSLDEVRSEYRKRLPLSPWEPSPVREILGNANAGRKLLLLEIISGLDGALVNRCEEDVWFLVDVAFADGLDSRYSTVLCRLLREEYHRAHEDIVSALEEIRDPSTVEAVYQLALKIPEWDEGSSLPRKCIWALHAIGTADANRKLRTLAESDNPIVREIARDHLKG